MKDSLCIAAVLIVMSCISSCAPSPKILSANSSGVLIASDGAFEQSAKIAQQQCEKSGKNAVMIQRSGYILSFDCRKK